MRAMIPSTLPELLAPAGSPEALEAALHAGADAIYLGGARFNARMNAHNFDKGQLSEAVTHAHTLGGRVYLTLNTLLWDRELPDAVSAAYEAADAGVDALIIADLGAAACIRRALPGLPLHASTQLSGHNARMGEVLAPLGFSRFVIARETSLPDLATAVQNNPLEVEVFIHGALCVSHSGQCLFSSIVGGRSGNRGECAQPCRLPYGCGRREESYPLSLRDLSLAAHVPALIDAGISSLKIEGRMKSPGYVSGVTAIWRRLLDERRAATIDEMTALSDLFSRGGFTDGYQTGRVDHLMMGIRSDHDKERTAAAEKRALAEKPKGYLPVEMGLFAAPNEPIRLTATAPLYRQGGVDPHMGGAPVCDRVTVEIGGDIPISSDKSSAEVAEIAEKQLTRTGGTPYTVKCVGMGICTDADEHAPTLPLSRYNALRREALEALDKARLSAMPRPIDGYLPLSDAFIRALPAELLGQTADRSPHRRTARFRTKEQITNIAIAYFDLLYLPLGVTFPDTVPLEKRGIILPPVIFDHERDQIANALQMALSEGSGHVLVGNLGHLPLVKTVAAKVGATLTLHADHRLNPANTPAAARLLSLGFADVMLAPELTLPRMRDISRALSEAGQTGATSAIVYGRLPLMLLEKCAIRSIYGDRHGSNGKAVVCRDICARDSATLVDRMGKSFPILREDGTTGGHRNSIYNSLPLCMSDRQSDLSRAAIGQEHYLFSVESPHEVDRVIAAYRDGLPIGGEVRRMMK